MCKNLMEKVHHIRCKNNGVTLLQSADVLPALHGVYAFEGKAAIFFPNY